MRCPNGHPVTTVGNFCTTCGSPMVGSASQVSPHAPEPAIASVHPHTAPQNPRLRRAASDARIRRFMLGGGAIVVVGVLVTVLIRALSPSVTPFLFNMTVPEAEQALTEAHLVSAPPTYAGDYSDLVGVPSDSAIWWVSGQDVDAYAEVARGTEVAMELSTGLDSALKACTEGKQGTLPGKSLSWDFNWTDPVRGIADQDSTWCLLSTVGVTDDLFDHIEQVNTSSDVVSYEDGLFTFEWSGGGGWPVSGRVTMNPDVLAK